MNTAIKVDKISEKDIISTMTPTGANALSIDENKDAGLGGETKVIPLMPGMRPSPSTLSILYGEVKNYQLTDSPKELFPLTQEEIKQFIKILFETPYTNSVCEQLLQQTQAIATQTAQADEVFREQLLDIALQLPYLKSTIYTLLDPQFHATFLQDRLQHIAAQNSDQASTQTLFEIISTSPQWMQEEDKTTIPQSHLLQKNVKTALIEATTTTTTNIPEESTDQETPSLQRAQELWSAFIEKLERTQGEYIREDDKEGYAAIRSILNSKCVDVVKNENSDRQYRIVIQTSEKASQRLEENKQGKVVLRTLRRDIIGTLGHEYNIKAGIDYRCSISASTKSPSQNTLPLTLHQQSVFAVKEKPSHFLDKIYKDYNAGPIPPIDHKKHFATYSNLEPKEIKNINNEIIRPRDGSPILCVSSDHNSQYIFATLNRIIERYKEQRGEKKIARTVSAQSLIKMNQLGGQMYRNAIAERKQPPENPFLKISEFVDYLVITGAEKFLTGESIGTFSWLFSDDAWKCHTILVSSNGDVDSLPEKRIDPKREEHKKHLENIRSKGGTPSEKDLQKKFRPDIPMRSAMGFNQIEIPAASTDTKLEHIDGLLKKNLSSAMYGKDTPSFSPAFYTGIKNIAQGDYTYLKQIMQLVAQLCGVYSDEKEIFTKLYMHCKAKRLFRTPIHISGEEIYQIVAAHTVSHIRSLHPDNEGLTVGDMIVKDAIARTIAHIYLSTHKETAPIVSLSPKGIVEILSAHSMSYTQADLKNYKSMQLHGLELKSFVTLCSSVDQQLIHKLMNGHIDTNLCPEQKDPFANGKSS